MSTLGERVAHAIKQALRLQAHLAIGIAAAVLLTAACAAPYRHHGMRTAYYRANPCPATGKTSGTCPGYQIDHIKPLCGGGPDRPDNMQWLSVEAHKEKTRADIASCRAR